MQCQGQGTQPVPGRGRGEGGRSKKQRQEKLTFKRHFPATQHSHMLYLIGHSILSAGLQRLQMGRAQRERRASSKSSFQGGPPYSSIPAAPHLAAARAPSASAARARHSLAANRRPAGHRSSGGPSAAPPAGRWTQAATPAGRFCSGRRRGSAAGERRGLGGEWTLLARMVLESVARIVKVQLPAYLKRLPVPESITGFARLTGNPRLQPVPILTSFSRWEVGVV